MVSSTADSGPNTLRQAILDANTSTSPATIDFGIAPGGPQTIFPTSPLPPITNPVTIDATSQPGFNGTPIIVINGSQIFETDPNTGKPTTTPLPDVNGLNVNAGGTTVKGLVINHFTGDGIQITSNGQNVITGNYIGTDITGKIAIGNEVDGVGVLDSSNNSIGGTTAGSGNLISGNGGSGVYIVTTPGKGATGRNLVEGNKIGTDVTGMSGLSNSDDGVLVNTSTNNTIGGLDQGASNIIAFNSGVGVMVGNYSFSSVPLLNTTILSNSIHDNIAGGIELDFGANNPVSSAQLLSAFPSGQSTEVQGRFSGSPLTPYTIQFFSNAVPDPSGFGQGQTLIGSAQVTTDVNGVGQIDSTLPVTLPVGQSLSATATGPNNATSTFFSNTPVAATALADAAVFQSVSNVTPTAGDTITYFVTAANNGPSNATNVVLTDTLPPGFSVSSVVPPSNADTVTQADGVVKVTIPTLTSGNSQTVQISAQTSTAGTFTNTASVSADQPDPVPANNTSTLEVLVASNPNPLVVAGGRLITSRNAIEAIVATFNQPLDPLQADNPINYTLSEEGKHHKFNIPVPLETPVYNPTAFTVTLTPVKPLSIGKIYQFQINGPGSIGLTNPAGSLLIGNTSSAPAGPWVSVISRGVVPTTPANPPAGKHKGKGHTVRLVESVTTRRLLSGPATVGPNGQVSNNLPPLVETTTGGTNTIDTT
jgi:uncharacterized repeat protein (TIGR01451 family)